MTSSRKTGTPMTDVRSKFKASACTRLVDRILTIAQIAHAIFLGCGRSDSVASVPCRCCGIRQTASWLCSGALSAGGVYSTTETADETCSGNKGAAPGPSGKDGRRTLGPPPATWGDVSLSRSLNSYAAAWNLQHSMYLSQMSEWRHQKEQQRKQSKDWLGARVRADQTWLRERRSHTLPRGHDARSRSVDALPVINGTRSPSSERSDGPSSTTTILG